MLVVKVQQAGKDALAHENMFTFADLYFHLNVHDLFLNQDPLL